MSECPPTIITIAEAEGYRYVLKTEGLYVCNVMKKTRTDFHEIFRTGRTWHEEQLVTFEGGGIDCLMP